jgi:hypothetical protein
LKIKEISKINVARPNSSRRPFGQFLLNTRRTPHFTCVRMPDLMCFDRTFLLLVHIFLRYSLIGSGMVHIFLRYSLIGSRMGAMGQRIVTIIHFLPYTGISFRATKKKIRTLTNKRLQKIGLKTRSYLSNVH